MDWSKGLRRAISRAAVGIIIGVLIMIAAIAAIFAATSNGTLSGASNVSSSSMTTLSSATTTSSSKVAVTACSESACNSTSSSAYDSFASNVTSTTDGTSTCTVSAAPPPQGIYLQLINDQGAPLTGLQVEGKSTNYEWCSPQAQYNETSGTTNSTGWVFFPDIFEFALNYSGYDYNFTIPELPMAWSIATLMIPAGIFAAHLCGNGGAQISSFCQAPTYTVLVRPQNGSAPFVPYLVRFWTNSSVATISNISLSSTTTWPPVTLQFFVGQSSIIFGSPSSFGINPDSNGTLFAFSTPNGTRIASTMIKSENIMFTNESVSGWVEILSWPA
jgi:hypothetical protein